MLGKILLALAAALGGMVVFAAAASAHVGQISINCTGVTFSFSGFTSGATIDESVTVNGVTTSSTFNFTGTSGSNTIAINGANGDTVSAQATWTVDGGGSASAGPQTLTGCTPPPPPCPPGNPSIHVRWHYSANGSSGSWSGTTGFTCPSQISMGPQAMEGNLQVAPGATLKAGYDFTIPGNNNSVFVTFTNPEVTFSVGCANHTTPTQSTVTVPMPTQTYNSTNGGNWYPSGDQSSSMVYQGSISVPNVCGGGNVSFQNGGTFTATLGGPQGPQCPCSLFSPASQPAVASSGDPNSGNLGVQFIPSVNGSVTGIRFYKGSGNTGTHIGELWTSTGTLLGQVTFTGESASGWQQANFSSPIAVTAGTTYVASYFDPAGNYSVTVEGFSSAVTNGPLTAPASSSVTPGNGVFNYSGSASFPNSTFHANNYFVDVVFS